MEKQIIKNLIKKQEIIYVDDIHLDLENPRYHDILVSKNKKKWSEEDLREEIIDDDLSDISESIKEHGILDPIWVVKNGKNNYDVIEGSRRLVVLKKLLDDKEKPPTGIRYDKVRANIIGKLTPEKLLDIQRVVLQTGKKSWGPYNVASVIQKLSKVLNTKQIAKIMGKRVATIDKELANNVLYKEYVNYLKNKGVNEDPRRYTYFQRSGADVRKKFFSTQKGKKTFFDLITPKNGQKARISSVALSGGLMQFNTITQDDQILENFLNDSTITVEEALGHYKGQHIVAEFPWAKKMLDMSRKVQDIDSDSIKKFKKDKKFLSEIKYLYKFCQKILDV